MRRQCLCPATCSFTSLPPSKTCGRCLERHHRGSPFPGATSRKPSSSNPFLERKPVTSSIHVHLNYDQICPPCNGGHHGSIKKKKKKEEEERKMVAQSFVDLRLDARIRHTSRIRNRWETEACNANVITQFILRPG